MAINGGGEKLKGVFAEASLDDAAGAVNPETGEVKGKWWGGQRGDAAASE